VSITFERKRRDSDQWGREKETKDTGPADVGSSTKGKGKTLRGKKDQKKEGQSPRRSPIKILERIGSQAKKGKSSVDGEHSIDNEGPTC